MPKRLLREQELYSSAISLVVLYGLVARTFNEDRASWFEAGDPLSPNGSVDHAAAL
jgi:hypothetical protein